jgi:hypothetical protein
MLFYRSLRLLLFIVVPGALLAHITISAVPPSFDSEEAQLTRIIQSTKITLSRLELLERELREFKKQETLCLELDPSNPARQDALYQLSSRAFVLLKTISQANMEDLFRNSFLEDLRKISKMAENRQVPQISKEVIE